MSANSDVVIDDTVIQHELKVNGIRLYCEETGSGTPLLFIHEFAGDHRSWEPQVRFLGRRYRCITYAARGYLPSEVPPEREHYSQELAIKDAVGVLDALGIEKAHIIGLSMGGYATVLLGVSYPERALSLTICGCGYGSSSISGEWYKELDYYAQAFLKEGMQTRAVEYASGPPRVQLQNKDPRGWAEFCRQFLEHSPLGAANTFLEVQKQRPNLLTMGKELARIPVPALILVGDEDDPALEASLYMKQVIPGAALEIFPRSGHTINLEEPERFNRSVLDFLTAVAAGKWQNRDPRNPILPFIRLPHP